MDQPERSLLVPALPATEAREAVEAALSELHNALEHEGDTAGYSFLPDDEGRAILQDLVATLASKLEAAEQALKAEREPQPMKEPVTTKLEWRLRAEAAEAKLEAAERKLANWEGAYAKQAALAVQLLKENTMSNDPTNDIGIETRQDLSQDRDRVFSVRYETRAANVSGELRGRFALEQLVGDGRYVQDFVRKLEAAGFRVEIQQPRAAAPDWRLAQGDHS